MKVNLAAGTARSQLMRVRDAQREDDRRECEVKSDKKPDTVGGVEPLSLGARRPYDEELTKSVVFILVQTVNAASMTVLIRFVLIPIVALWAPSQLRFHALPTEEHTGLKLTSVGKQEEERRAAPKRWIALS